MVSSGVLQCPGRQWTHVCCRVSSCESAEETEGGGSGSWGGVSVRRCPSDSSGRVRGTRREPGTLGGPASDQDLTVLRGPKPLSGSLLRQHTTWSISQNNPRTELGGFHFRKAGLSKLQYTLALSSTFSTRRFNASKVSVELVTWTLGGHDGRSPWDGRVMMVHPWRPRRSP